MLRHAPQGVVRENLRFPQTSRIVLFASDADAQERVAFQNVKRSHKAVHPIRFFAQPGNGNRLRRLLVLLAFLACGGDTISICVRFFCRTFVEPLLPQLAGAGSR